MEFQLRDEAADSFILNLLERGVVGETYGGVLLNYLRYTVRSPDGSNNNYDRIPTAGWWSRFVGTAEKIKNIKVAGLEYNYFNLESFIVHQCAGSLRAFVEANGGDVGPLLDVIAKAKLSRKHEELLAEMRLGK